MALSPAQYLIRFDDLCPTMLSDPWERFVSLVTRYGVTPILAVVPDNQDPALKLQPPDLEFWNRMRSYQAAGFTIAMHGYRHLCTSRGKSLLGLHEETEFAGVNEPQQREWIRSGLEILRENGINPRLFVAPRHGFDHCTLRALAGEGLGILSDGFARRPFTRHEVIWIPQQLWEPVRKSTGLWTICIHTNTATHTLEDKLERFLAENAKQFTSFDNVVTDKSLNNLRWNERLAESLANLRVRISRAKTRMLHSA
jgi:predicted deacetylase